MIHPGDILARNGERVARFAGSWSYSGYPMVYLHDYQDEDKGRGPVPLQSITLKQPGWVREKGITDGDLAPVVQ